MEKCSAETVYKPESLYPGVTKGDNVDEIATGLQKKASKASVLAQLREIKAGKDQLASEKKPSKRSEPEQ